MDKTYETFEEFWMGEIEKLKYILKFTKKTVCKNSIKKKIKSCYHWIEITKK